ncbi:type VI secretion system membrane subunit TssM [Paracraurococcus lichenis]|uniref:Type VI secretion system membrane subunit TssM n=1 Tax=Paracraurococcus lichenis TaxID=3064888 RepID=A0ABT9DXX1_9PROT|nr:type VI secretion system membrane subunit TssM [Paracraurococcus sp. LOR1-02]MDO9708752.1 type VI secretion system membrane subunit TssM [Paracraurococcus sp. LOR1-02]
MALRRTLWRWVLTGIGALLLGGLAWVFGPLLEPLEPWPPRAAIGAAIALAWGLGNWLVSRRNRRTEEALVEGAAAGPDTAAGAADEEAEALRERLTLALETLRRARGTRGYLYEQPWYVIIGPPGAGKTTALLNAGLHFPLAEEMGQAAVAGAGGTRLCDWWFTDEAVLIDTAGRYTTQDSEAAVDRAGWEAFLDALRRGRPRQPLNGVIVAIALSDIAAAPEAERLAHARAIRRRIKELEEGLGIRLPVYALLTKADLLAGFTEYFDDLGREQRTQVWGVTFPIETATEAGPVPGFAAEFHALAERIEARLMDRLQEERSAERRALIAGFPTQLASLEAPLAAFLREAFGGSRLNPAPFLRGVYLTSGTQEGTPIDRLTAVLARAFGIDQRRPAALRPGEGRSYFLGRLLREVIFGEAMLVASRPSAARRARLLRGAAWAACLLLVLGGGLQLWSAAGAGTAQSGRFATALAEYEAAARGVLGETVGDGDLAPLVPVLDRARALSAAAGEVAWWDLGLSQDGKLAEAGRLAYRRALQRGLLPRLLWRLEAQMRGGFNRPDFLYEATRIYLMLGSAGPLDRDLVRQWMALDWAAGYPGATAASLRERLGVHLAALLDQPLPRLELDGALVEEARRAFSRVPLAERVYSRIRPSAAAAALPPWRPADAAGLAGQRLFARGGDRPMTEGVPGFYTVEGFHRVLLPALPRAALEAAGESWVLGTRAALDPASPGVQTLERDVVALYVADYARAWDALLADLNPVLPRTLPQAVQDLFLLGAPQSPMRDLLQGIARQLTLSRPPEQAAGAQGVAAQAAAAAKQAADSTAARLGALLGQPAGPPPGSAIDERYKALRELMGDGGPGAPLDRLLGLLNDLQRQLGAAQAAQATGTSPPVAGPDPALLLQAEAGRQPEPVGRWLAAIAARAQALRGGSLRQQAAAAWSGSGGSGGAAGGGGGAGVSPAQLCRQVVEARFPFRAGGTSDTPLDDFIRLFAPGGVLDALFNTQLRPFVDMTGRTWRPQAMDGVPSPLSPEAVAQFQRAALIREAFFAGAPQPAFRFDITPAELDPGARQAVLDLDGVTLTQAQGPARPLQVTWPGPARMASVSLSFDPPPAAGAATLQATGPWALLRLLVQQGTLRQAGGPDRWTVGFAAGERRVRYDIRAGASLNPLSVLGELQAFRCPVL